MLLPAALFGLGQALAPRMTPVAAPVAWAVWLVVAPQAWATAARLRDRGLSAWWGLAAIAPVLLFQAVMAAAPDDPAASPAATWALAGLSVLGLPALLALVVVCGVLPGRRLSPGPVSPAPAGGAPPPGAAGRPSSPPG